MRGLRSKISRAMRERTCVRFRSKFDESSVHGGYVYDVGSKFVLVAIVNDRLSYDGFECFRINDLRDFEPDPYGAFVERALKLRGQRKPVKPLIKMGSIGEILVTAGQYAPLVTIVREQVDPEVAWIGRILGIEKGRVRMLEIEPGAVWETEPRLHRLSEITRVTFGADYEDALYLVGGEPAIIENVQNGK
jgi:hypothetical protein